MKIWEDDNQKYIKAMMEKNTTEQNEKLTKRLEEIDFSVLEHIERKETVNERGVFAPLQWKLARSRQEGLNSKNSV